MGCLQSIDTKRLMVLVLKLFVLDNPSFCSGKIALAPPRDEELYLHMFVITIHRKGYLLAL